VVAGSLRDSGAGSAGGGTAEPEGTVTSPALVVVCLVLGALVLFLIAKAALASRKPSTPSVPSPAHSASGSLPAPSGTAVQPEHGEHTYETIPAISSIAAAPAEPFYHAWRPAEEGDYGTAAVTATAAAAGGGTAGQTVAEVLRSWELADGCLEVGQLLGSGQYGEVHEGVLSVAGVAHRVAVKTPKAGGSGDNSAALLSEAALMAPFDHPNVVALVGVVTRATPCKVVLQLCTRGSLQAALQAASPALTRGREHIPAAAVLRIAADVAAGMAYLEAANHVHRDLATRNTFLHENGYVLR